MRESRILRSLPSILFLAVFVAGLSCGERAVAKGLEKINASYASPSASAAPLWIAKDGGFFRKQGLDVKLVLVIGGSRSIQALLSNSVQFAGFAAAPVIRADLRGAHVVFLACVVNRLIFSLTTVPSITKPEQLKGKIIGLTNYGGVIEMMARMALKRVGLNPDRDVQFRALGADPNIVAAMRNNLVQGTVLNPELLVEARRMHFNVMLDLSKTNTEFFQHGVAARRSLIRENRDLAIRFMKGYIQGIAYYKTHPEAVKPIIAKYSKNNDPEYLDTVVRVYGQHLVPKVPVPSLKAMEFVLNNLKQSVPKARSARAEEFIDPSIVNEIERSGFIKSLYPQK